MYLSSALVTPFKLTFVTDGNEVFGTTEAVMKANENEASGNVANSNSPLGTMGFSLQYIQQPCPWYHTANVLSVEIADICLRSQSQDNFL